MPHLLKHHLRAHFHHPIRWDFEEAGRAAGVAEHGDEQLFAPQRHFRAQLGNGLVNWQIPRRANALILYLGSLWKSGIVANQTGDKTMKSPGDFAGVNYL